MDLTHRFHVPAPVEEAWAAFNHLESLAPCFPGATLTSVEGDDFAGTVKIKLGPIALLYNGTGTYVERDESARRVVIEARGKDKRGNGTATAKVTARFAGAGDGTDVEVATDLAITGKPAQFGRGVISDVSDKLLDQFVSCVSGRFTAGGVAAEAADEAADEAEEAPAEPTIELGAVPGDLDESGGPETPSPQTPAQNGAAPTSAAQPSATPPPTPRSYGYTPPSDSSRTDLNVLTTILPVLLKRYGPALGGLSLAVYVLVRVVRRLRHR